jgi:enediyne biosynthesis protein E7
MNRAVPGIDGVGVCGIERWPVNVLLRLQNPAWSLLLRPNPPYLMTLAIAANRRPPGPDEPVVLGIDPGTLEILLEARRRFGNVVALRRPNGRPALFVNDPAEIRRILVRQHARYRKGPGFERVKMLLGNGLIVSDGDVWRRSRTMIQPAFSRANMHRLVEVIGTCCRDRERRWSAVAKAGGALNITQETSDFALELILRSMFGDDYERYLLNSGTNPFAFLSEDSTRDLRVVLKVRELRELLLQIVAARRASGGAAQFDFLSIYLAARDKDGNAFEDRELLDELVTLIVAGYETSAGTLNWAWYLLACNPGCHDMLVDDAGAHLPNADQIDADSVAAMTYTQALLEETLRLYPPVWLFTRRAAEEDSLTNFDVEAGTDIFLSPYILHRSEDFWPQPDRFEPGRFGPDSEMKKGERPYFPFSLGPRRCLGEYFSFLEMKIHLGLLARKFRMSCIDTGAPPLDLGINLRSATDIFLRPSFRTT